jgi:hypothetical protein
VNHLADIESIKCLKYRYFRTLDTNDWDAFAACLAEDCTASYGDGRKKLDGRKSIVDFMSRNMSGEGFLSMHNGHHPEISIAEDGLSATGTWYLQDMIIHLERNVRLYGTGIYEDEYVKANGEWTISRTSYARIFECVEPLGEHHNVLKNMFAGKA